MDDIRVKALIISLILSILSALNTLPAAGMTAREIMLEVVNRDTGQDVSAEIEMTLRDKKGRQRERRIKIQRKEFGEDSKTLIRFISPANLAGTGFLTWNHKGKDDDQWLYLPATRRIRRITTSIKHGSFMGSDFSHDDLREREVDEDTHRPLRKETLEGEVYYVIESVPKDKKGSNYSKLIQWVRADNFVVTKIEFYDRKGSLLKTLYADEIVQQDGIWVAKVLTMENIQTGHQTLFRFKDIKFNSGIKDEAFTTRNLEHY